MSNLKHIGNHFSSFPFSFLFFRFSEICRDPHRSPEISRESQRLPKILPEIPRDSQGSLRKGKEGANKIVYIYIYICVCIYSYIILYIICSLGGVNFFDFFLNPPPPRLSWRLLGGPCGGLSLPGRAGPCRTVPDRAGLCRIVPDP